MKLLPQKQLVNKLNDQKLEETKAGLFLARKIDQLREDIADTQKEHDDRVTSMNREFVLFSGEMASKKFELEREIKGLEIVRLSIQKPLDEAWEDFNLRNNELLISKKKLLENEDKVKAKSTELDKLSSKIDKLSKETTYNQSETMQKLSKADILLQKREKEYEIAKNERLEQYDKRDMEIRELSGKKTEYEVALNTLEIKKKELEEKESELIIREKHLASQQVSLQRAMGVIKNYGK